jgi:hypothetical protein
MTFPTSHKELVELFTSLGAPTPEEWVSHVAENPGPQLARYLFLKQAWERLIADGDTKWIAESIQRSHTHPEEPYAGLGQALGRAVAMGVRTQI